MELEEFKTTYDSMLDAAAAIIHNQQILANVNAQLDKNLLNPFEQDLIHYDRVGKFPAEAQKISNIFGVVITARTLHQTGIGLRDIRGADLLYEIEGRKFGLIQYKRASDNCVKNDKEQLEDLLANCPEVCKNRKKRQKGIIPESWLPLKTFTFCGNWYRVYSGKEQRNVTACEAESIFQGQNSRNFEQFRKGLSSDSFDELFASCRIGALVSDSGEMRFKEAIVERLIETKHFILNIVQRGTWRSHAS